MVKHTRVKVFLINLFPFKFDKCAPKTPPKKEPSVNKISKFRGTDSILNKHNAPIAFQKIPTLKKVNRIALRKSIPKVLIKRIVTNKPVPDDIDPFKIAIKVLNVIWNDRFFFFLCFAMLLLFETCFPSVFLVEQVKTIL